MLTPQKNRDTRKTNRCPGVRLPASAEGFVSNAHREGYSHAPAVNPCSASGGAGGFLSPPGSARSGAGGLFPCLSLSSVRRRMTRGGALSVGREPGVGPDSLPRSDKPGTELIRGGQGREPGALVASAYIVTIALATAGLIVLLEVAR